MAVTKILTTGATGYIGGSFLSAILNSADPTIKAASVSTLVRRQDQADLLASHGIIPILFKDLDDTEFLTKIAAEFDIVVHIANGFHEPSARALIKGLGHRKARSGKEVYYIHNSGTSNFGDQAITGTWVEPTPRIFSDKDDIYPYYKKRSVVPYPQRDVDIAVMESGVALGVRTYIICTPLIYGFGTGFFNRNSVQMPNLIRDSLTRGAAAYVGDGSGMWNHSHVVDVAELYTLILGKLLAGEQLPSGKEGFYFADQGTQTWKELAQGVADAGFRLGKLQTSEPTSITLDEATEKLTGGNPLLAQLGFASRSVTRGDKSRELGWKPVKAEEDWQKTFLEEYRSFIERNA